MHGFTFKFKIMAYTKQRSRAYRHDMTPKKLAVADYGFGRYGCGRYWFSVWSLVNMVFLLWPRSSCCGRYGCGRYGCTRMHGRSESDRLTTATIEKSLHFYFGKHWQKMQHRKSKRQLEVNAEMCHGDFGECNFNIFMLLQPLRNAQHSLQ